MKKLVCIVGGYAPYFSPGGKIAHNVLIELKDKYDITVIARRERFSLKKEEEIDGIHVIRLNDYNQLIHSYCNEKIRTSNAIKCLVYKSLLWGKRAMNYLIRLFRRQDVSRTYIQRIKRQLCQLKKETEIDVLIPVSEPHEAVFASYEFKKKNPSVIVMPYQMDFFATGNSLYENALIRLWRYPIQRNMERKVIQRMDRLFVLPPLWEYYSSADHVQDLRKKIIKTEHALLKKHVCKAQNLKDVRTVITYAGSLDINLRNPEYFLSMLEFLKCKEGVHARMFTFGNCQAILDKYGDILGDTLEDYGRISSEEVEEQLGRSDVLLSIGNNSQSEVPSKLFDLMSYGKPMVHLYYDERDPCLKYLKTYPRVLLIHRSEENIEKNAEQLEAFLMKNKGVQIPFDNIEELYGECKPEYVATQIHAEIQIIIRGEVS